ncbi:MAG: tRNA (N(6)-L-threonylcarbamoyladenosine(37)-C(2))-methylthiotransferase MtaB [Eubacteriales bacterium]
MSFTEALSVKNSPASAVGKSFVIHTLGCKVNQYESQVIREHLESQGLSAVEDGYADICIINTCAVTAESERKARQIIRRTVSRNPDAYVIVTGCYAQLRPGELSAIPGVAFVCGNRSKLAAADAALRFAQTGERLTSDRVEELSGASFERAAIHRSERTRAYVKIEDGCQSKCAYCTIKDARGPVRSKSLSDTVNEVTGLVAAGYREIVLTGIEISAWGRDNREGDLADLIAALSEIPGLVRVRLGSLDPSLLTPAFTDRIASSANLAPHFHLSLQSGCDKTLAAMRRRYNTAMIARNVAHLRERLPNACFTADTIVGFPGESEEDFAKSARFIESLGLLYNHIFPFSRRPGTEADRMDGQLPESVKSERLHRLEAIRDESTRRVCEGYIGSERTVLFEEFDESMAIGHTDNFLEVAAPAVADLHGRFATVRLDRYENGRLIGRITHIYDQTEGKSR